MALQDVIKIALEQFEHIAKTETVFGEAMTVGGVTIIPVSKVSVGFAAGGAGKDDKSGSGAGTGGGVNVTPVALVTIMENDVRVHPLGDGELDIEKLLSLAPEAVRKIAKFFKKKVDDKKPADKSDNAENVNNDADKNSANDGADNPVTNDNDNAAAV